jgi:hypothetical protein
LWEKEEEAACSALFQFDPAQRRARDPRSFWVIAAPQGSPAMTVQEQPYPVVSLVIDTFGEWLKHRRELKEMNEMDAANFGRIASELRMSSTDLEALVRQGPHAADELPKMLAALGIDQEDLARTEPFVLRDMERVCSLCNHKRQCDRDLAAGTAAAHYEEYCGNADTIDGLGPRANQ